MYKWVTGVLQWGFYGAPGGILRLCGLEGIHCAYWGVDKWLL